MQIMKSKVVEVKEGNFIVYENGDIYNAKTNNKLKPIDNGVGYDRVGLYAGNNKHKLYYVHRLLAIAFIDNPDNKQFINHIDGNTKNNELSNLEWCTKSENGLHAFKLGLNKPNPCYGEKNGNTYITNKTASQIKELFKNGKKQCDIARHFNITKYVVYNIIRNKTWKHIN
jgi:hypothetical protein